MYVVTSYHLCADERDSGKTQSGVNMSCMCIYMHMYMLHVHVYMCMLSNMAPTGSLQLILNHFPFSAFRKS